jgi:hypothetical protein
VILVCLHGLNDQFHVGGGAQELGDDVGGTGEHAALKEDDIGRVALDGEAEVFN